MPQPSQLAYMASLGFASWPPREVVRTLHKLGYAAVEWTMAHFDPRNHSAADIAALVAVAADEGLAVSEVVVQQDLVSLEPAVRRDRRDHLRQCIEAAAQAGIGTLNLFSGPAPWDPGAPKLGRDISEGAAWDQVLDAFGELVPLAEAAGVRLAVEAVFGMVVRDYYTTLPLLQAFDSPALGLNFDPSHYQLYRNDVPWTVRRWGLRRIFHVHLKDCVGVPGGLPGETFTFPLLGEGALDWPACLGALDEIGYTGYLSVEFEAFSYYSRVLRGDPVAAARLSMEQCRALLGLPAC